MTRNWGRQVSSIDLTIPSLMLFQPYWDDRNWYHHQPLSLPSTHTASLWTQEPRGDHGIVSLVLSLDWHWLVSWSLLVSSTPHNSAFGCIDSEILKSTSWERVRTTQTYSPLYGQCPVLLVVMLNKCVLDFLQDYALTLCLSFWPYVLIYSFI